MTKNDAADDWIDSIKSGDLIKAKINLSMSHHGDKKLLIDRDEALLVLEFISRDNRVAFDVILRGEHYNSAMEKKAFNNAFASAAKFDDAIS